MTDLRAAAYMALEFLEHVDRFDPNGRYGLDEKIDALIQALAQAEQEPVHFLANGVRYKVTHQGYYGCSIVGLPENLNGQWVALVEATDSKHLNCIAHQESTKPEQEPVAWVKEGKVRVGFGRIEERKYVQFDQTLPVGTKLYTAPLIKPWVSLTDEQIDDIASKVGFGYIDIATGVEAALKELNHG